MATTTVDVESLKHELKAWERKFKQEHGTDKISKEDVKAHPDIDAKYKLWRELSKVTALPVAKKQGEVKPATTNRAASPPSTPRAPSRKSEKASVTNIFQKSMPTRGPAITSTSNPFSPTKGKGRALDNDDDDDDEHIIRARRETGKKVAFQSNPLFVPHTPVAKSAASASSSSASRSTEPPNPFAPSPTKDKSSRQANLFITPSKSAQSKSFETVDTPATSLYSSTKVTRSSAKIDYNYADSPKKLKALISSTLKDTPRTKSRKRLRGEEVTETPGDKRRRLAGGTGSQQGMDDNDEDAEEEEMDFSPVKPTASARGKAFRPVFDDVDKLDARAAKPSFFSRTNSGSGPAFSKALSRISSLSTSTLFSSKAAESDLSTTRAKDDQKSFPAGSSADRRTGKPTGKKRSSAELDDSLQTGDTTGDQFQPNSAANPFALRPPSPPPGESNKDKNKWGAGARKKGKVDVTMLDVEDAPSDDEGLRDGLEAKEIRLSDARPSKNVDGQDEIESVTEEDAVNRYFRKQSVLPRAPIPGTADHAHKDDGAVQHPVEVDLPDEMKRVLNLGNISPSKRNDAPPEDIVHGVFTGSQVVPEKVKLQEIWGVGELEGMAEKEEDDWDSDPDGWKGAVEM